MNDEYFCDGTGCSNEECACWNNFCKVCSFETDGDDCPKCHA